MNYFRINQQAFQDKRNLIVKVLSILIMYFGIYSMVFAQVLNEVDAIFPFHENLAAVKKGNDWAFINKDGDKVIDFRNDMVLTMSATENSFYPIFVDGKCLIKKKINDEYLFGYIDTTGTIIIEPQFLNATNFKNGYAMIIKSGVRQMGSNNVLGKKMVYTKLEEYIIDSSGKIIKFLDNSRAYIPAKNKKAPTFKSKILAPNIVAIQTKSGKLNIEKIK